jgi:GR25 family glycosyltransferase involved in LPS biosynthesis
MSQKAARRWAMRYGSWAGVAAALLLLRLWLASPSPQTPVLVPERNYFTFRAASVGKAPPDRHQLQDDIFNSTLGVRQILLFFSFRHMLIHWGKQFQKIFAISLPYRTDRRDGILLGSSLSGLDVEIVDGVEGSKVADKSVPKDKDYDRMGDGALGCWRSHVNVLKEIVRLNISSAMIMEDDADWDVRIKQQMADFGKSTRALIQPLARPNSDGTTHLDPSYPKFKSSKAQETGSLGNFDVDFDFDYDNLPETVPPTLSPYGDDWDVIWTGHCGMDPASHEDRIPQGRVVRHNDETVPAKEHFPDYRGIHHLTDKFPEHTRLAQHVKHGLCLTSYAVSQRGARRLLYLAGILPLRFPIDGILERYCDGFEGRPAADCLAIQPGLFHPHRPAGDKESESDISQGEPYDRHKGFQDKPWTASVRWSVRINAERLLMGEPPVDQWPEDDK